MDPTGPGFLQRKGKGPPLPSPTPSCWTKEGQWTLASWGWRAMVPLRRHCWDPGWNSSTTSSRTQDHPSGKATSKVSVQTPLLNKLSVLFCSVRLKFERLFVVFVVQKPCNPSFTICDKGWEGTKIFGKYLEYRLYLTANDFVVGMRLARCWVHCVCRKF